MEALRTDTITGTDFPVYMARMGAQFLRDRSNDIRHVYFSRRLNRWFAVSSLRGGMIKVSHYNECPCSMRT